MATAPVPSGCRGRTSGGYAGLGGLTRGAVLTADFKADAAALVASSAGRKVMRDHRARLYSRPSALAMVEPTATISPESTRWFFHVR